MNSRERFLATMNYQPRDRVPWGEMGFWPETIEVWHKQGMPQDVHLADFFGFDRLREGVGIHLDLLPGFDPEVLEETDEYRIVRRATGVTAKEFKGEHSFRMPQWLAFPLQTRDDWEKEFKPRLNPDSPARYPLYWAEQVRTWAQRDYPLAMQMGSVFGWLRNWMGLEAICLALYDDPEWVQQMMDDLVDFVCAASQRLLQEVELDYILLWEDMAYNHGSLISPTIVREWMMPRYKKITAFLRDNGVKWIMVDCDGQTESLFPIWLEAGIDGMHPCEIAAGCDPVAVRPPAC